jgi:hypothetical protein
MTRHHWPSATTAIALRLPPQLSPPPPNPSKKKDEKKEIGVDEAEVEIEGGGRGDVSASMCLACPAHRGREEQITFRGEERASSLRAPTLRRKKSKAPRDRRHYGPPRPPHSLPRRWRPWPVPGPDLERKGTREAARRRVRERATGLRRVEHHRRNGGAATAAESREGEGGGWEEGRGEMGRQGREQGSEGLRG